MNEENNNKYSNIYWAGVCGICATIIGLGIGRFAFVPLIPAMVSHDWYSEALTGYLGSSTLLGYLIGGITAHRLSEKFGSANTIKLSMVIITIVYFGCFNPFTYPWFVFCRLWAGIAGAWLTIIAPGYIFYRTAPEYKARVSGAIFSGIGLGVVVSGYIVPHLLDISLSSAWIGLGSAALFFTLLSWRFWVPLKQLNNGSAHQQVKEAYTLANSPHKKMVVMLLAAYALDAVGFLAHTIYWVNFIVQDLNMSFMDGGFYWVMFGVGAIIGPYLTGYLGDKVGLERVLIGAFVCKSIAVFLPLYSTNTWALMLSSLFVGGLTSGVVSLVSAVTLDVVGRAHHKQVWGWMTISFATTQAIMGYGIVFIFTQTMDFYLLFKVCGCCLIVSTLLAWKINSEMRLQHSVDNTNE
ncbi:YbfB/YjiJ family MFS transporter [Shewanella sp. 202IG2-18]|uniref:YbfB/YjiJ family MFS transporter n=1 Tax=Parashewanella hymeniacidonis TaxID=2807618 RepID=UPI0019613BAA|nr:YbfB/YjiJ family MFS transporter [Parashewanella hymeniacidonis]MBM7071197.1 YbfB/YjiJ family MFS transporter [Parashewanella hymeniacidonis]